MNVCHVTDASGPADGGLFSATRSLASALSRSRALASVTIAGRRLVPELETEGQQAGVRFFSRDTWRAHLRSIMALRPDAECGWSSADICHAHGMWAGSSWSSLAWRLKTGRPLIVAPHGMLDGWALQNRAWIKKLALASYEGTRLRRSLCVHALCEAEMAAVERLGLGVPVYVIPNVIEIPSREDVIRSRSRALDPGMRSTLLYLGRLHPKKGIELVIRGLAEIAARSPRMREQWRLDICGSGDSRYVERLRSLPRELGVGEMVSFRGPVSGHLKREAFASASAFVLTSYSEGLPMAVLEAWAFGLPSLVSERCNLSRATSSGAALQTTTRIEDVTAGLRDLLEMDDLEREKMANRARAYVQATHAWDKVSARVIEIYRWSLGGGPRPERTCE